MRVHFMQRFDWRPPERNGRVVLAFPAGFTGTVRRCCGEAAVQAGKAREIAHVRRKPA